MMIILYKIISGIGIPTLRYHHNKIKMELLKLSPKNLLDIGSAKGEIYIKLVIVITVQGNMVLSG